jgi:hypothetical protein
MTTPQSPRKRKTNAPFPEDREPKRIMVEIEKEVSTRELDQEVEELLPADQEKNTEVDDGREELRHRYISHHRLADEDDDLTVYVSPFAERKNVPVLENYTEDVEEENDQLNDYIILPSPGKRTARKYPVGPSVIPFPHRRVQELRGVSDSSKPDPHSPHIFPRSGQLQRQEAGEKTETLFSDWRERMGISKVGPPWRTPKPALVVPFPVDEEEDAGMGCNLVYEVGSEAEGADEEW